MGGRLAVAPMIENGPVRKVIPVALEAEAAEVEALLGEDFFAGAPFRSVLLFVHVAWETDLAARYGSVARGELPARIVVAAADLRHLRTEAQAREACRLMLVEALVGIGDAFGLGAVALRRARERGQLGFRAWWRRAWHRIPWYARSAPRAAPAVDEEDLA